MANSSVVTDLVANDKVTAAVDKAQAGLARYAANTRVNLQSAAQGFDHLRTSLTGFSGGLGGAVRGATALTTAIGSLGVTGVSGRALSAINALVTGLQALTSAQVLAQAFSGPGGWATLAVGAATAAGALALLSVAFDDVGDSADEAARAAGRGPWSGASAGSGDYRPASQVKNTVAQEIARIKAFEVAYRNAAEAIRQHQTMGMAVPETEVQKRNKAIKEATSVDLDTWAQRYRAAMKPIKDLFDDEIISAAEFERQERRVQESLGMAFGPMEQYKRSVLGIAESYREGRVTAEAFAEEMRKLADSQFGPLLTEALQDKLNKQFADIEQDFQQRFGRNLTPDQAERERQARRRGALENIAGIRKTPQEELRAAMERAAVAERAGERDQAAKIRRDAWGGWSQGMLQAARDRAGLSGPFARLATDAERLKAELAAIKDAYTRGAFGAPGSAGAVEVQRRSVAAALEQYGRKVPDVKPRWEGLQETWKRIQESAAGRGNSPEERAVRVAEANKGVLTQIFGETKEFNKWLQKWFEKKEDNRARAG